MPNEWAELINTKITNKMPPDKLYQRIMDFLKSQTMCVISTSSGDVPRATPVEYYNHGTTFYIMADPGVKVENIKKNPRVSIGIYNMPHPVWTNGKDWAACKSVQVTGTAKLLVEDNEEYAEFLNRYKWQIFWEAVGFDINKPPKGRTVIKVEASKMEYMEFALKREGYSSRQTWMPAEAGK